MLTFIALLAPLATTPHEGLHARIEAASRAIEAAPSDGERYLARAELHREHGNLDLCLEDLEAAQSLQPALVRLDLVRGRALAELGCLDEAAAALDRFLARRPDDPDGRLARADVRERVGDWSGAEADLAKLIGLALAGGADLGGQRGPQPHTPSAPPHLWLSLARVLCARGDTAGALALLDEGRVRLGGAVTLELAALELEQRLGHFDAALARVDRLRGRAGRPEGWTARRGDVLELAGHVGDARAHWRLALEELSRLPTHVRRTRTSLQLAGGLRERLLRTAGLEGER